MVEARRMKRVTGIGGVFFKAKDPVALRAWYQRHLGVDVLEWGGAVFRWGSEGGATMWAVKDGADEKEFVINYRVHDLDALLAALREEGCNVLEARESGALGKFGWVVDPEGNKVELWEPPAAAADK